MRRLLWGLVSLLVSSGEISAGRPAPVLAEDKTAHFTCGSFDQGDDERDVVWSSSEARQLRGAIVRYCEHATADQRKYCHLVIPLALRSHCTLELYGATAIRPAHAALGIHPARPEWVWYVTLERVHERWRVQGIVIDDLERP